MKYICRFIVCLCGLSVFLANAEQVRSSKNDIRPKKSYISIVIDDLGNNLSHARRVISLPGKVTCSIFPHSFHGNEIAELANASEKEVMLHLPLQSLSNGRLGKGGLVLDMEQEQFLQVLNDDLKSIPYVVGVNNHMGSLLTMHPGHMQWLMEGLKSKNELFFLDSRTTKYSVAEKIANEVGLANTRRNVFLDHYINIVDIEYQFHRLLRLAKRDGTAVAIGHPFEQTLSMLEKELPLLDEYGVELISVSEIIKIQQQNKAKRVNAAD